MVSREGINIYEIPPSLPYVLLVGENNVLHLLLIISINRCTSVSVYPHFGACYVCLCYNGTLALWHLRRITKLKAWIICCRCSPGKRGDGRVSVFVWRQEEEVTCCWWLALNIRANGWRQPRPSTSCGLRVRRTFHLRKQHLFHKAGLTEPDAGTEGSFCPPCLPICSAVNNYWR